MNEMKTDSPQRHTTSNLIAVMTAKAREDGLSNPALANILGISYIYLMQLITGRRDTAALTRKVLVACANFLNIPVVEAYLLAGALKPTDFVVQGRVDGVRDDAYQTMLLHSQWGGFMPSEEDWKCLPQSLQLMTMLSFEQATGLKIFNDLDKTMFDEETATA